MHHENQCGCGPGEGHGIGHGQHGFHGRGGAHHDCGCGCGGHHGGMHHGHGAFMHRRFISKDEVVAKLEEYLEQLQEEAKGVEEHIAELKKQG